MNEVYICTVLKRFKGCILKKNFCCGKCDQREACMKLFNASTDKRKIKPCSPEMAEDCPYQDTL